MTWGVHGYCSLVATLDRGRRMIGSAFTATEADSRFIRFFCGVFVCFSGSNSEGVFPTPFIVGVCLWGSLAGHCWSRLVKISSSTRKNGTPVFAFLYSVLTRI